MIKALSIMQPWAWLIVNGWKDLENRTWTTSYRGQLLIHASKDIDFQGYNFIIRNGLMNEIDMPEIDDFQRGGIVGQAELYDIVTNAPSDWAATDQYHWILRDAKPLPFIPCRGALSVWTPSPEILQAIV
jgi:hypothetical protein